MQIVIFLFLILQVIFSIQNVSLSDTNTKKEKKNFKNASITTKLPSSGELPSIFKHKYLPKLTLNFNKIFRKDFLASTGGIHGRKFQYFNYNKK